MNLLIDTHLNDVVIILEKDGKIVKKRKIETVRENSKIIMPVVKKVINKSDIESIIVVNGPGSFTGVRIGVVIAKTLAVTLNVPIRTITTLECMAVSIEANEKIVSFSDNNGYYIGFFTKYNTLFGEYRYASNKEYEKFKESTEIYEEVEIDYPKVIEHTLKKNTTNPHEVNPVYVKSISALRK